MKKREDFSKAFVGSRQYSSPEDILLSRFYCLFAALCLLKIVFPKRSGKWFLVISWKSSNQGSIFRFCYGDVYLRKQTVSLTTSWKLETLFHFVQSQKSFKGILLTFFSRQAGRQTTLTWPIRLSYWAWGLKNRHKKRQFWCCHAVFLRNYCFVSLPCSVPLLYTHLFKAL